MNKHLLRRAGVLLVGAAMLLSASQAHGSTEAPQEPLSIDFVISIVGQPESQPLSGERLERLTQDVSVNLRCPVCQGSSVGDSPSQSARNMKGEVRDLLAAGFSPEQVVAYFEFSYGEFVRLDPKAEGFNLVVWVAPVLLLLGGLAFTALTIRRMSSSSPQKPVASDSPATDDPELVRYLEQVRDLAYGADGSSTGRTGKES